MSQRRIGAPSEGDVAFAPNTVFDDISANRYDFLRSAGFDPAALTLGRQVHGDAVEIVGASDGGRGQPPDFDTVGDCDGLITASPDIALGIIVADCVPILIYDPTNRVVSTVHAGWRGTVLGIAGVAVRRMQAAFGSQPNALIAGIGPSIGPCCYEVGDEVIDAWINSSVTGWPHAIVERQPRSHLDLWRANQLVLETFGVPAAQIELAGICTRCATNMYFSHRAAMAGERPRGRMIMVAQIKD